MMLCTGVVDIAISLLFRMSLLAQQLDLRALMMRHNDLALIVPQS
jgi:hypothetical protein